MSQTKLRVIFQSTLFVLAICLSPILVIARQNVQPNRLSIDFTHRFQTIDGFGVNFNGTYFRDAQKPMIDLLIDDLGATIFRLDPYGLLNWEAANDNDDPKAMNWVYYNDRYSIPNFEASWAAARYLNSKGIKPYLALSGIPPIWMLDEKPAPPTHKVCNNPELLGHRTHGETKRIHLNPAMYDEFAEEVVSLAMYARQKARIDFEYFGPINETDCYPDEGPRVDPDEMPLVLEAVSNRLKKEGMDDLKLVAPEQVILPNNYVEALLEHKDLMQQIGVFSFHTYGESSLTPHLSHVYESAFPHTKIWLTEYGELDDLNKSAENEWKKFSLAATRRALRALNEGASAALFWDAYDNYHEHYPRLTFYGLVKNADHLYTPKKRYYAAKQLYRYVRPGSQRLATSGDIQGLKFSAFWNGENNSIVIVGVKEGGPRRVPIVLQNLPIDLQITELYQTTPQLDCALVERPAIKNGTVELDLPDESVFTLLIKARSSR